MAPTYTMGLHNTDTSTRWTTSDVMCYFVSAGVECVRCRHSPGRQQGTRWVAPRGFCPAALQHAGARGALCRTHGSACCVCVCVCVCVCAARAQDGF
jgi:hypothetical protein